MSGIVLEQLSFVACGERLRLVTTARTLDPGTDPVAAARDEADALLVHSTSWRYADGAVVLTFALLLPDADWHAHAGAVELSVADLEELPVACHAVRHLHFLHRIDPEVGAVQGADGFWGFARQVVTHHYPAVAGLLP